MAMPGERAMHERNSRLIAVCCIYVTCTPQYQMIMPAGCVHIWLMVISSGVETHGRQMAW
jgi:hypothetical protein